MDLSLLQNFQTLIGTSLQSIVDDARIQYDNLKEELTEQINHLAERNLELEQTVKELTSKIEEHNFSEDNFNRVSIISNLNKQIKQLKNENDDLRNCLNKNMPMNPSLARAGSPSNIEDAPANQSEEEVFPEESTVEEDNVDQTEKEVFPEESTVEEDNVDQTEKEVFPEESTVEEDNVDQTEEEVVPEESTIEEDNANQSEEEVEEALEEIEYKSKTYYVIDGKLYNKKKDGSQGKQAGKMVDGKPKLKKKKKTSTEKN